MMKQKSRRIFTKINICIAIVIVFGIFVTFISEYNYLKIVKYDSEIKDLKIQIAATRDSFKIYEKKLHDLNSDPETLEKIVREEYYMKRDNEDVYIVKEK